MLPEAKNEEIRGREQYPQAVLLKALEHRVKPGDTSGKPGLILIDYSKKKKTESLLLCLFLFTYYNKEFFVNEENSAEYFQNVSLFYIITRISRKAHDITFKIN